ncbi:MAG: single-stranded DNA-binding protein [Clostridiales bacterium]|jgi:single-strand DNA-binding protein|nr:single-stranded DNA-binding protein [Clostridiales bacterium]
MNKAILMGRLTRDPEVRYSQNNLPIANFTLAVNRRFSRQGEERQADFIPIVTFDKTAEFCEKYFRKGQQVSVVGRIQVRSWDDNEGKRRYMTEVVGEEVYFADSRRQDGDGGGGRQDDYGYYSQPSGGGSQLSPQGNGSQLAPGGAQSPYGAGAQAFGTAPRSDGGADQRRSAGRSGGGGVRNGGVGENDGAGIGTDADDASQEAPSGGDDGFLPVENESDLPF